MRKKLSESEIGQSVEEAVKHAADRTSPRTAKR